MKRTSHAVMTRIPERFFVWWRSRHLRERRAPPGYPRDVTDDASAPRPSGLRRLHAHLHRHPVTGLITKVVVTAIGLVVLGAGLVMMVTPGPGIVGILGGLAILATEWHWARRLLHWARRRASEAAERARAMDPAVRRRRALITALVAALVAGGVSLLVWQFGWPSLAIDGWDKIQSISSAVPELPGM